MLLTGKIALLCEQVYLM